MSDPVIERVSKCIAQVVAATPDQISPSTRLMDDLGADSLDLVELMFLLEQEFSIRLSKQDLSLSAQLGLPEEELHQNEVLTPKALELLRARFPQANGLLHDGITRQHLASLLTVEAIADSIRKKLPA